jgi:phosphomannomutase
MTADLALRLGQAAGIVFKKRLGNETITAIIGKDTRNVCL